MLIYEMLIIDVDQAGSGSRGWDRNISMEGKGEEGHAGDSVEQAEQVVQAQDCHNGNRKEPPTHSTAPNALRPLPMGWNANPNKTSWEEQAPVRGNSQGAEDCGLCSP